MAIALAAIPATKAATPQTAGAQPQSSANAGPSAHHSFGGARALEGVWDEQIMIKNCITGSVIFTGRGQNVVIRGGALVNTTGAAMTSAGPGLGNWWYDPPGRHYGQKFRHFTFDPATGAPTGFQITQRAIELSKDGNSTTAEVVFETYNLAGTLLGSGCASTVGTRILED